ncbi:MAG TPA: tRNA (adenosine(37)-N6)-threonylcarbamoyltransferase complex ATPase subunit type 1 TsaE [Spirochaetota bacterium]|nr:tRNA (adenosine(37)-N6)-threonylcarbamoyltransferase complex ATPase subunit type 1 TsaE [Spirochaetota bacterium]
MTENNAGPDSGPFTEIKMKKELITRSSEETLMFGEKFGRDLKKGDVVALTGDLGAGKTIIAKGIAMGMDIIEDITSPTFTLMEIYDGHIPLYHFDLYRIENESELDLLYFEEYWENGGISVIEWADRAGSRLPDNTIRINIEYIDENSRRIVIERPDN